MRIPRLTIPALILTLGISSPAHAAGFASLDTGLIDNIMNAASGVDLKDVSFTELAAGFRAFHGFSKVLAVQGQAALAHRTYSRYGALDNTRSSAGLVLMYKPGAGYWAPTWQLSLDGDYLDFESTLRRGTMLGLRGGMVQQLTTRLRYDLTLEYSQRRADHRAFDGDREALSAGLDWQLSTPVALYWKLAASRGDSTVSISSGGLAGGARASAPDDAFKDGVIAYRLETEALSTVLGLNWQLTSFAAIDARARCEQTRAYRDADYDRCQMQLGVLLGF